MQKSCMLMAPSSAPCVKPLTALAASCLCRLGHEHIEQVCRLMTLASTTVGMRHGHGQTSSVVPAAATSDMDAVQAE